MWKIHKLWVNNKKIVFHEKQNQKSIIRMYLSFINRLVCIFH